MDKKELGIFGEKLAKEMLLKKGYEILECNWRFGKIELDIICRYEEKIIFVEVKTRESDFVGPPWEAVNLNKQRRIIKAANDYIIQNEIDTESRFDIISIIVNSKTRDIEHLEDAFYPRV